MPHFVKNEVDKAITKVNNDLERMADLAGNLTERVQAIADARKELADARSAQKGAHLKGAVDVRSIIKKADALPEGEKVALGPDFDDEEEVPPLQ